MLENIPKKPYLKTVLVALLIYSLLGCITVVNAQQPPAEVLVKTGNFPHQSTEVIATHTLDPQIPEGSGLVAWNGLLYTHNDSGTARIFALDPADGKIVRTYDLPGIKNRDWEDITQDARYLYLGDIGNNSGNQEQLPIYRIEKEALQKGRVVMDSIIFSWPRANGSVEQVKINFDCEAMAVIHDSIYLFTKEWKNRRCTRIFRIPITPGRHTATYVSTLKTRILVTGADYNESTQQLVLCGYSLLLTPKLLVLPFPDSGNWAALEKGQNIRVRRRLRQTEGIAGVDGKDYYLISEGTHLLFWKNKPKLYKIQIGE